MTAKAPAPKGRTAVITTGSGFGCMAGHSGLVSRLEVDSAAFG